jgi:hypothetical protein
MLLLCQIVRIKKAKQKVRSTNSHPLHLNSVHMSAPPLIPYKPWYHWTSKAFICICQAELSAYHSSCSEISWNFLYYHDIFRNDWEMECIIKEIACLIKQDSQQKMLHLVILMLRLSFVALHAAILKRNNHWVIKMLHKTQWECTWPMQSNNDISVNKLMTIGHIARVHFLAGLE